MTAAAPMTLPGGRALVGWWRDCAAFAPRRLWFAHLVLHRVEALVEVDQPPALAGLTRALLAFLARKPDPLGVATIATELDLEPSLVATLLGRLREGGFVEPEDRSVARLTSKGREARNDHPAGRQERRSFYFTDTRPPVYLPLSPQAALPLPPPAGWRFDLGVLEGCLGTPAEWKRQHGFPAEVVRLVWTKGAVDPQHWREVPLDRPEQAYLLLVEKADGGVVGLSAHPPGWELVREPVLTLPPGSEVLPGELGPEAWRQSWQAWCQQRSLPAGEVEACKLEAAGHRLVVKAPHKLVERLRQAKSEALRGEAWLLAGSGRVRAAGLIEVVG